jgi:hypothetical protein
VVCERTAATRRVPTQVHQTGELLGLGQIVARREEGHADHVGDRNTFGLSAFTSEIVYGVPSGSVT